MSEQMSEYINNLNSLNIRALRVCDWVDNVHVQVITGTRTLTFDWISNSWYLTVCSAAGIPWNENGKICTDQMFASY